MPVVGSLTLPPILQLHVCCVKTKTNNMKQSETITFRTSRENIGLKKKLIKLAKKQNRTLNNFIENVFLELTKDVDKNE